MTQLEIIKQMLDSGEWVCGRSFLREFIPEYRTRINELRKKGLTVKAEKCTLHPHKGNLQMWRLIKKYPVN